MGASPAPQNFGEVVLKTSRCFNPQSSGWNTDKMQFLMGGKNTRKKKHNGVL